MGTEGVLLWSSWKRSIKIVALQSHQLRHQILIRTVGATEPINWLCGRPSRGTINCISVIFIRAQTIIKKPYTFIKVYGFFLLRDKTTTAKWKTANGIIRNGDPSPCPLPQGARERHDKDNDTTTATTRPRQRQKLYQFLDCHGATKRPLAMTDHCYGNNNEKLANGKRQTAIGIIRNGDPLTAFPFGHRPLPQGARELPRQKQRQSGKRH
jgi:hypothetical protein